MSRPKDRQTARDMRLLQGASLNQIAHDLGVSKGTVSLWVRDIELSPEQRAVLKLKQKHGRPGPPGKRGRSNRKPAPIQRDVARRARIRERSQARFLRARGASYTEIARMLKTAQATATRWVSDIDLTEEQRAGIVLRSYRLLPLRKRLAYQMEGRAKTREGDLLHLLGCMLYWGEGSKSGGCFCFVNSDPNMMASMVAFLKAYWPESVGKMTLSLAYYTNCGLSEEQIVAHWLGVTGVLPERVRKHQVDKSPKSSKGKRRGKLPYGTCTVRICDIRILEHIRGAIAEYARLADPGLDTRTKDELEAQKANEQIEDLQTALLQWQDDTAPGGMA